LFDLFGSGCPNIVVQEKSKKLGEALSEVGVEAKEGRGEGRLTF
jgi:hypothetical protein